MPRARRPPLDTWGCGGEAPCGDQPGVDNVIASTERWVHVLAPFERPAGEGTLDVEIRLADVIGTREGPPRDETLSVHESLIADVERGLNRTDDVYLALMKAGCSTDVASFVVLRDGDGRYHLPRGCMAQGETLLRQRLGDGFDPAMARSVGETDPKRILRALRSAAQDRGPWR